MRTLRLDIQYLGTGFFGWQVQPGKPTIQGHLESALGRILNEKVRIAGAGRTDAGVHARGQVASLATFSTVPERGILLGTNNFLPDAIRVMSVVEAPRGFHARHLAISKEYAYRFSRAPVVSPFLAPTVAQVRGGLDPARMDRAAAHFLGEHDLTAFCGAEGRTRNAVRRITASRFVEEGEGVIAYRISAPGFLQHLVRTIVGTLLEVGRGRIDPDAIPEILASRDRSRAGPTAEAKGLTLERVNYNGEAGGPGRPEVTVAPFLAGPRTV